MASTCAFSVHTSLHAAVLRFQAIPFPAACVLCKLYQSVPGGRIGMSLILRLVVPLAVS